MGGTNRIIWLFTHLNEFDDNGWPAWSWLGISTGSSFGLSPLALVLQNKFFYYFSVHISRDVFQTWRWNPLKTNSIHDCSLPEVSPRILYLAPEQRKHNFQPDIISIKPMLTLCYLGLPGEGCLAVLLWEAAPVPHLADLDTSLT